LNPFPCDISHTVIKSHPEVEQTEPSPAESPPAEAPALFRLSAAVSQCPPFS
jgi:hypothetical protein